MSRDDVDLEPLARALDSLDLALELVQDHEGSMDERTLLRDGVIQRFEFGFELAWKTLRRFLQRYGLERVEGLTHRELFRRGVESGLLDDAEAWIEFLQHRNLTSHIYDEATAARVYSSARPFLDASRRMLRAMKDATS